MSEGHIPVTALSLIFGKNYSGEQAEYFRIKRFGDVEVSQTSMPIATTTKPQYLLEYRCFTRPRASSKTRRVLQQLTIELEAAPYADRKK